MTNRCTLFLTFGVVLGLAADGALSTAQAADLSARPYLRSFAAAGGARAPNPTAAAADVTGTVNTRTSVQPSHAPVSAAAAHARTARARFDEARAAMERGLLLREAAPKTNVAVLEAAVRDLSDHLAILEQMAKSRSPDSIKKANSLVQDWYAAGLKIISPPAEGVVELPMPTNVRSKADAAAAMLDQVAAEASAYAPPRAIGPSKKRAYGRSRSVASGMDPALASAPSR